MQIAINNKVPRIEEETGAKNHYIKVDLRLNS